MEALVVSNLILWVMVIALSFVVFALVRQVGVLHERVAPVGALATAGGPKVGEAAPALTVRSLAGSSLALGGAAAGEMDSATLLFFLSPTCPVCKTLLPTLERVARDEGPNLRLVLASDGPVEEHERYVAAQALSRSSYVVSTELGLAYQVGKLPYAVLIDREGIIRAKGLVNTREHIESLFTAKEHGVASIQDYIARRAGDAEQAEELR